MCTQNEKCDIISIEEYRKILNDSLSSGEEIKQKINYLETFLRNVIKTEIENCIKK